MQINLQSLEFTEIEVQINDKPLNLLKSHILYAPSFFDFSFFNVLIWEGIQMT